MQSQRRTALITGASRGLGLALAKALATDGWQLILNARGATALEEAQRQLERYTRVWALPGDVTDPQHRQQLAEAAREAGGLDLLVNNAGALGPSPQPELLEYPLEIFGWVLQTNVVAPLGVLQAVRSTLKNQAVVINITSDAAVEAYPGWGGYGASKVAFEQLSAVLAVENPDWRVYWVDPGDMRTEMHQAAFPGEDISDRALPADSVPGLLALILGKQPSGRYYSHQVELQEA